MKAYSTQLPNSGIFIFDESKIEDNAYTYWDGSDFKTIWFNVEDSSDPVNAYFELIDSTVIILDFKAALPEEWKWGQRYRIGKLHTYIETQYQSEPWIAIVVPLA